MIILLSRLWSCTWISIVDEISWQWLKPHWWGKHDTAGKARKKRTDAPRPIMWIEIPNLPSSSPNTKHCHVPNPKQRSLITKTAVAMISFQCIHYTISQSHTSWSNSVHSTVCGLGVYSPFTMDWYLTVVRYYTILYEILDIARLEWRRAVRKGGRKNEEGNCSDFHFVTSLSSLLLSYWTVNVTGLWDGFHAVCIALSVVLRHRLLSRYSLRALTWW